MGRRTSCCTIEGNATFTDRTEAAGLNVDNDRYSFACAWGDLNSDGSPDLYVANDFGRSNLYRNNGDGTFTAISTEAGVEDAGAGMSACWFDFDNDGNQDIYVANMWSAAGQRVSEQKIFHEKDPENIRALYRRHARGNSLYRNQGNGKFQNVSGQAGVEMGRWAWSSDAWDFDHDGYPDLYIANGYISGPDPRDLSSFFWRQVVGNRRRIPTPSSNYEQGWNAINELIRSDSSWSGSERNVFYANNGDGTFSEVSGAVGLDFPDDSRVLRPCRHRPRRAAGGHPQKPERAATARPAQRDERNWRLHRLPPAWTKKQSRCHRRRSHRGSQERSARPNIFRPAPDFCRSTPRSFSSGWGKARALYAPRFAGPAASLRRSKICRQTAASKFRKEQTSFWPSLSPPRLLLMRAPAIPRNWSPCQLRSRPGSSSL